MLEIKQIHPSETWGIRHRVMWANKPFEGVKLLNDDSGLHFGLFRDNVLLSVVSLFIENDTAQFRKFATEIEEQGRGYGAKLLEHIIQESIKLNVESFWCNARTSASGFYEKFGLAIVSDTWVKDGIEYVKMERNF
ncbi:MAG: GNAT family N-acetyltransferase [Arcicella sp.]|nr:GNAT family N-acetyltransferase [Arcicella sp.]